MKLKTSIQLCALQFGSLCSWVFLKGFLLMYCVYSQSLLLWCANWYEESSVCILWLDVSHLLWRFTHSHYGRKIEEVKCQAICSRDPRLTLPHSRSQAPALLPYMELRSGLSSLSVHVVPPPLGEERFVPWFPSIYSLWPFDHIYYYNFVLLFRMSVTSQKGK